MNTPDIVGKWTYLDTIGKKVMTFCFDEGSNASINYGDESVPLIYSLDNEESQQVLTFVTPDNRKIKSIMPFRSNNELELFISRIVDFNINIQTWGINEFMLLKKDSC